MDTIDVTETEYGIDLILNGEVVRGYFDGVGFIASGKIPSLMYEVLSCSCGSAGCSGIFYGTRIKRRRFTVEWRDVDSGLPKRFYSFAVEDYDAALKKARGIFFESEASQYWTTREDAIAYRVDWMLTYNVNYLRLLRGTRGGIGRHAAL